jgi:hypothetical protein
MGNYLYPLRAAKWRPGATYFNRQCRQRGRSTGSPGQGVTAGEQQYLRALARRATEGHVILLDIIMLGSLWRILITVLRSPRAARKRVEPRLPRRLIMAQGRHRTFPLTLYSSAGMFSSQLQQPLTPSTTSATYAYESMTGRGRRTSD